MKNSDTLTSAAVGQQSLSLRPQTVSQEYLLRAESLPQCA